MGPEDEPLLSGSLSDSQTLSRAGATVSVDPEQAASVTEATVDNGPSVTCRVCDNEIPLEGRTMNHVVRCGRCNEATPIRAAPPGKKYVRCPCHCLLICKASSSRIACPRENCRRVITLGPSGPVGTAIRAPAGTCRVQCCECQEIFMFNTLSNTAANCPHCRTSSSVGTRYKRTRALIHFIFVALFLSLSIGFTVSWIHSSTHGIAFIITTVVFYICAAIFFYKFVYYLRMKVSQVVLSEVNGYDGVVAKLEGRDAKTNPAVIYYCGDRTDGKSWCPDCVRSDEILTEVLEEIEEKKLLNRDIELITCFVGDRPTWKDPEHPARHNGITSIPTFVRYGGRTVSDPDVTAENIRDFLISQ